MNERNASHSRRSGILWIIIAAVVAPIALASTVRADDEVLRYLRRHELDMLLASELERRMTEAVGPDREDIVLELADVYVRLLSVTDDEERREDFTKRGQRLIQIAPPDSVDRLRLALLRGPFRQAEAIAERHRMRYASDEELQEAISILESTTPRLEQLYERFESRYRSIQRTYDQSQRSDVEKLAEVKAELSEYRMQACYILGWSLYYQAWIDERPDLARDSQVYFGRVLDAENPYLNPNEVSRDLRELEYIARTILGMALAKSIAGEQGPALSWLDLLKHPNTYEPIRNDLDVWYLLVRLEHADFDLAQSMLQDARAESDEIPLVWVRLAAVYALQMRDASVSAEILARFAIAELASMGELDDILDLSDRFGKAALGDEGFAMHYVSGALSYRNARNVHDGDEPTEDAEARGLYESAAIEFAAALLEDDADEFPKAAAGAVRLLGYCHYFRGDYLEARYAFEQASQTLPTSDADEALWMAIVSLDQYAKRGGSSSVQSDLFSLIDRFLQEFPSSQWAPRLVLRRSQGDPKEQGMSRETVIAQLLSVPPNSEVYPDARQRAAWLLFLQFRDARGAEQVRYGNDFLGVALPLLNPDDPATAESASGMLQQLARARRILEVALSRGIGRSVAAQTALDAIETIREFEPEAVEEVQEELTYRRVRLAIWQGYAGEAASLCDQLWENDRDSMWAGQAARVLFKEAFDERRDRLDAGEDDGDLLPVIVRYGSRVLEDFEGSLDAASDRVILSYYMAVADAAFEQWRRTEDEDLARQALELYDTVLLPTRPSNAIFLRAVALLSDALNDTDRALECWRKISAGADRTSERWFEARFHVIELLSHSDPARAWSVLVQHRTLYPEYGPDPWGPRIKGLEVRLQDQGMGGDGR